MYVGTERGNIYMVHVETFKVSGYIISWNHVIDVYVIEIKSKALHFMYSENMLLLSNRCTK